MTFAVSSPTSLFCLTIVILSLNTQNIPGFHLINICNTICLTFLAVYITTRTTSPNPASDVPQTYSPSPPSRTPPSPPTPRHRTLHPGVEDQNSFLDLSSEESFQDSGLGVSISSLDDAPSEGEETGGTTQLVHPPKIPDTDPDVERPAVCGDPASNFRDRPPRSPSSESSFGPLIPDTPGTDHDEDEEYITLEVMTFQRTVRRCPAESHEDPIITLVDCLAKLNLGYTPSRPTTEIKKPQPSNQRTQSPTPAGNSYGSIIIPKLANCCKLANHTFTPDSWEGYNFCSTSYRFIRPMDEDAFFRSTRLAVDNLKPSRSGHYLLPNQPVDYRTLGDVFKPFGSAAERYFRSRLHDGVIVYESAFGVVDFSSEEEAYVAFRALQGRRIKGERAHWRLEFLDPEDVTFGERLPNIRSGPPLELIRRLDVVSGELERIDDTPRAPPPPTSDRLLKPPRRRKGVRSGTKCYAGQW